MIIPTRMRNLITRDFGAKGSAWLDDLPALIQTLCDQWNLALLTPFEAGAGMNMVVPCTRAGLPLVLKVGYPHPEALTEISALEHWKGRPGRVQLIASDRVAHAALMEHVLPGTTFRASALALRSSEVPALLSTIPIPIDASVKIKEFPEYRQWFDQARDQVVDLPGVSSEFLGHVERAGEFLDAVELTYPEQYLLHGDLHHENMLLNEEGQYVAIDPKGVIGSSLLEYGRFIHNFASDESADFSRVITERLQHLAGDYAEDWLLKAGYIDLVLSTSWMLISGDGLSSEREQLIEAHCLLLMV